MWGRERRVVVRGRERLASILRHHAQKPLKQFRSCVQRTRVRWFMKWLDVRTCNYVVTS